MSLQFKSSGTIIFEIDDNIDASMPQHNSNNATLFMLKLLFNQIQRLNKKINHIVEQNNIINFKIKTIMLTIDDLKAAVQAEDSVIDSAITLIQGLATQIANLPAEQAAIDALATEVKAKGDALAAAVTANTPAGTPTTGA